MGAEPGPAGGVAVSAASEQLLLLPGRAVLWAARRTLVIADPHFGKDDLFRRSGIALPRGPAIADLQRLTALVHATRCERLLVLGDFLHGPTRAGDSFLHAFRLWRRSHAALTVHVIAGNHDRREPGEKWSGLLSWLAEPLVEPPLAFAHEPAGRDDAFVLAGHLHPAMSLPGLGAGSRRVPVFWMRARQLVLPSFGSFTGGASFRPGEGDRVFAAGPERVVQLF